MVATWFSVTLARIPIQDCKETVEFHYRKAVIITKLLKNTVLKVEKKRCSGKSRRENLAPTPCNASCTANPIMQREEDAGALRPR